MSSIFDSFDDKNFDVDRLTRPDNEESPRFRRISRKIDSLKPRFKIRQVSQCRPPIRKISTKPINETEVVQNTQQLKIKKNRILENMESYGLQIASKDEERTRFTITEKQLVANILCHNAPSIYEFEFISKDQNVAPGEYFTRICRLIKNDFTFNKVSKEGDKITIEIGGDDVETFWFHIMDNLLKFYKLESIIECVAHKISNVKLMLTGQLLKLIDKTDLLYEEINNQDQLNVERAKPVGVFRRSIDIRLGVNLDFKNINKWVYRQDLERSWIEVFFVYPVDAVNAMKNFFEKVDYTLGKDYEGFCIYKC